MYIYTMNELLIALVNSVLGTGKKTAGGNIAYIVPIAIIKT